MKPDDRDALARMLRLAFGGDERWSREYFDPEKNARLDPDQVLVADENGEVRASTTVLPMEVFVDGTPAPMGGIAAVTTDPAYRRRGYARRLLEANLRDMRRRETHLSMLDPFSHAFYRASGWETASDSILYSLSPKKLPTGDEQRHIRAYREKDAARVREILIEKAARHQACVRRSEGRWRQILGAGGGKRVKENEVVVFAPGGDGVEGYAMYSIENRDGGEEPTRTLHVRELIGRTREAREGLVSFLAAFDPEEFEVSIRTPRSEPLHPYLKDSFVKAEVQPGLMLRLVDVEGALGYLERSLAEPLVLEIEDHVIPENNGGFTVGDGEVRRGANAGRRVRLDVRQLSRLYAGYLPARALAGHGLISPDSEAALTLLEEYFPVLDPFVFPVDHF